MLIAARSNHREGGRGVLVLIRDSGRSLLEWISDACCRPSPPGMRERRRVKIGVGAQNPPRPRRARHGPADEFAGAGLRRPRGLRIAYRRHTRVRVMIVQTQQTNAQYGQKPAERRHARARAHRRGGVSTTRFPTSSSTVLSRHLTRRALRTTASRYRAHGEIPQVLAHAVASGLLAGRADSGKLDGAIALGCVIRGETSHYESSAPTPTTG